MNYRVIVLLPILLFLTPNVSNGQVTGALSLDLDTVSLEIGESANITATLTVAGVPTSGATLLFEDGTPDIEEAFIDLGNGSYIVPLRSSDTATLPPGNYTERVLARLNGEVVANATLSLEITASDFVSPEINIVSSRDAIEDSNYKLNLWGRDETEWMDLSIFVGGVLYYFIKNPYPVTREEGSVRYNQTHVYFDDWINIKGFSKDVNFTDNKISIAIRDRSFNSVNDTLLIVGDYIDPLVTFLTPNYSTFSTRDITIEWEVKDDSNISKQVLFIDGKEWIPLNVKGETLLDPNDRSLTFFLSVPKTEGRSFTVRLEVTDEFGNVGGASVTLLFDNVGYISSTEEQGGFASIVSNGSNPVLIGLLVAILTLAIVGFGVVVARKFMTRETATSDIGLNDKLEGMFNIFGDSAFRGPLENILRNYLPRLSKGKRRIKKTLQDLRNDLVKETETKVADASLKDVVLQHIKSTFDSIEGELER